jgi:hypothetical protein
MKKSKSLFQVAAEKYTNISSELKTNKKAFLEATVADLNKLYTKNKVGDIKDGVPEPNFDSMPKLNIGGSESSNKTESPTGGVANTTQTNPNASPVGNPGSSDPAELAKGLQLVNINGVNYIIADNPEDYKFGKASDFKEYQAATDKFTKSIGEAATTYTVEDIMSALSVLSGNTEVLANHGTDILGDDLATKVSPVGDMLVKEDDGDGGLSVSAEDEAAKSSMSEEEGDDNTDDANEVEEGIPEMSGTTGTTSASSELMSPTDGTSDKTSPSTGQPGSASSFTTEKQDGLTGVDDSYVTETGKGKETEEKAPEGNIGISQDTSKGAGEAPEENSGALGPVADQQDGGAGESVWSAGTNSGKPMAKGAGASMEDGTGQVGEQQPQVGEASDEMGPDGNSTGKDSAFWLPNDDLLGLKDIVGSVAKDNGVPNTQENIVKDPATGALVKKPTTPVHSIPNMRQFVKTNPPPGTVTNMGQGQPVNISDMGLDDVMGMDTANDRALNISMNFNF